tara:strand:- start:5 stop:484 length:480 start_codon:yes stop_codon:yes gene_type:complete
MKTINIKGKDYVEVNERVKYFRKNYPKHSLATKVIEKTEKSILIKAIIRDENKRKIATGLAEEIKGSSFINTTSHVENCETSAWGRALANFGIGIDTAIASSDEVQNAKLNQNPELKLGTPKWYDALEHLKNGEVTIEKIESKYWLSKANKAELLKINK